VATDRGRAAPTKATIIGARKGTRGSKKGQKHRPHCVAIVASNDNDNDGEEADNSGEEFVAAAERNFKQQTGLPKDHFEKLLEVTCPPDPYPIKHKLKDCTMIKKFKTLRTFS
jgi:hypothetical protein